MIAIIAKKIGPTLSYNPEPLRKLLAQKENGSEFIVVVLPVEEEKSRAALGYYWKAMVEHLRTQNESFRGWSKRSIHVWLKSECAEGQDVSEMDGKEFSEYLDRCKVRLAEIGEYIPSPSEWYELLRQQSEKEN